MPKRSAGLMMYRRTLGELQVLLVHPGGPFWARKDKGALSIPKGEYKEDELALQAAIREFHEETGFQAEGLFLELGTIKQGGGKLVTAWAFEGDCNPEELISSSCRMEWPPCSGKQLAFPEVDRGRWFSLAEARVYILPSQEALLQRLSESLKSESPS